MYLSQLELVGFKSFAQKTNVRFKEGITAIVGPNGCGKTNIVDALRWVLGEQKTSTLRSDKMNDVIFNGTKKRKPLGMAEVILTIENTKGILPTEFSEVTIARRLFRNGESQYLLNKTPCRLKDITNLFMDTGMGPDAYSVIELKMIETILSDKAEERRRLFEEASGVTKYKIRRKETLRRMESLQGDLARARDIIAEVEKTVRSLARQANKAQKYKLLADEIATLEKTLLAYEYKHKTEESRPLAEQLKEQQHIKQKTEKSLLERESIVGELEEQQSAIEERLAISEAAFAEARGSVAMVEREEAVAKERLTSLTLNKQRLEKEGREFDEIIANVNRRIEQTQERLDKAREELSRAEERFAALKEKRGTAARHLDEERLATKTAQEAVMKSIGAISSAQAESSRMLAKVENLRRRLEETQTKITAAEKRAAEAESAYSAQADTRAELKAAVAEKENALQQAQEQQKKLRISLEEMRKSESDLKSERSRLAATMDFLKSLAVAGESTRFLLRNKEWTSAPTPPQLLADVVNIDVKYRTALAAALGSAMEFFIVPTKDDAAAGIHSLRKHDKGRATFICLDSLVDIPPAEPLSQPEHGIIGRLATMVRADETIIPALNGLLGDTLLTETQEQAWAALAAGKATAAVSLSGELARKPGLLRGGQANKTEEAAIGKRERLEQLHSSISTLNNDLTTLSARLKDTTSQYNSIDLRLLSDAIRRAESDLNRFDKNLAEIDFKRQSAARDKENFLREIEKIEIELREAETYSEQQLPDMSLLHKAKENAEKTYNDCQEKQRQAEKNMQEIGAAAHAAELHLTGNKSELAAATEEEKRLQRQRENTLMRQTRHTTDLAQAKKDIATTQARLQEYANSIQLLKDKEMATARNRDEIAAEQNLLRKRIHTEVEELRNLRRTLDTSTAEAHTLQLRVSELRSQIEHSRKRALEEFQLDLTDPEAPVLQLFSEDIQPDQLKNTIRDKKSSLQSIGAVNLLAFEEHERENERLTLLRNQMQDLEESEDTLRRTILEINETAQAIFLDTFEKVRANFINIFQSLFYEGDEADLALEEGDPLEAQINITAKPRGKRPHSIEMLSGGEKTLTAIALLFAIYLVKPSPFCILDEVDAPLDDANIGRYVKLIREFSSNTQFIMITHNKNTMESADSLYGVTMEEEGVSRLVSVRFEKENTL